MAEICRLSKRNLLYSVVVASWLVLYVLSQFLCFHFQPWMGHKCEWTAFSGGWLLALSCCSMLCCIRKLFSLKAQRKSFNMLLVFSRPNNACVVIWSYEVRMVGESSFKFSHFLIYQRWWPRGGNGPLFIKNALEMLETAKKYIRFRWPFISFTSFFPTSSLVKDVIESRFYAQIASNTALTTAGSNESLHISITH